MRHRTRHRIVLAAWTLVIGVLAIGIGAGAPPSTEPRKTAEPGDARPAANPSAKPQTPAHPAAPASVDPPSSTPPPWEVKWAGTMFKVMMQGDITSKIALSDLAAKKHLCAVGALEGLTGEITVIDGAPSIARVRDKKLVVDKSMTGGAALLIYAEVPSWRERAIPADVTDLKALEEFVGKASKEAGLADPLPFRVRGRAVAAEIHVIDREPREPARVQGEDAHGKALVPFHIADTPIEIVGIWSDHGEGIITHHGQHAHAHLVTADGSRSGHLDALTLGGPAVLLLPATAK